MASENEGKHRPGIGRNYQYGAVNLESNLIRIYYIRYVLLDRIFKMSNIDKAQETIKRIEYKGVVLADPMNLDPIANPGRVIDLVKEDVAWGRRSSTPYIREGCHRTLVVHLHGYGHRWHRRCRSRARGPC